MRDLIAVPRNTDCEFITIDMSGQFHTAISSFFHQVKPDKVWTIFGDNVAGNGIVDHRLEFFKGILLSEN
jgi:hypothetical protein